MDVHPGGHTSEIDEETEHVSLCRRSVAPGLRWREEDANEEHGHRRFRGLGLALASWVYTLTIGFWTGKPFPKNFRETIGRLFRRLFRVYAHLYSNHFDHICALGIEGK